MKKDSTRDPVLVQHILKAVGLIESYVTDKSFSDFQDSQLLQDAVVRELLIIGEAAANLSDEFREQHPEVPYYEIIGMRNTMIHGYWLVDEEVVWDACKNDLPELKEELLKI
ncbi:MAG: hypothetical protein A3C02_00355 [Candidatus Andersenbacteria bacterium RIFCSPHIGHO2_02_FULL_45_11]|uniref:DUF86 domain-containing protein n=1 Tax=Candidatus Andersenbacteria bacterium RIFCSPHIGHO2_12_FULL_45_11 TaxID=1797281 RepID=A0A1G1X016_9BACT|nr:MAG: hypothetical protein A3D99_03120 [Candidatus Andersenbacteria bacterium RIFCSPHIGHO2_12_FULL_45_11]OGY34641.1 MAG: hypothetical protein A3C02_00355 [Candidatus Andersenbacteria bacterium RIFCSPHIGHO2_02_FULL_45_11]